MDVLCPGNLVPQQHNTLHFMALCDILYKRLRNTLTYLLSFILHGLVMALIQINQ